MSKTEKNNHKPFHDIEFKSLIIAFKGILVIFFFIISMVLIFSIKSQAITQDLNYTFENDYIFNSDDLDYETFNIRNQTIIFQDNYTATYDFLNENNGILIPSGWINSSTVGYIEIGNDYKGHNKVLKLNPQTIDSISLYDSILDIGFGTIEYWILNTDMTNGRPMIWLFHGGNELFRVYLRDYKVRAYNGVYQECGSALENMWVHIRIDFECTLGNYKGLEQYKFKVFNNGVEYGNFAFINNELHIDKIELLGANSITNYYFDAIGYSWDNDYTINQNIAFPKITTTEIQEIDKCEFAYNITTLEPNTLDNDDIDNNWIENDDSTNAHVKTSGIYDEIDIDYAITQLQDTYGIYKEFGYNAENIFNISFGITSLALYNPLLDGWYFNIKSYNDILLVSLLINKSDDPYIYLHYFDGNSYQSIHRIVSTSDFSLNIYINNRVILRLKDNDINYIYYFSELTSNIGINTIEVIGGDNDDIGDYSKIRLDYIGFYINGSSYLPDDLFSYIIPTDIEQWDDNIHNIFEITANGSFSFSIFYDDSIDDIIFSYVLINDTTKKVLAYNLDVFKGNNDYDFVLVSNIIFTISKISVYSISLKEGSNIYYPSFTYNGVDIQENYFYIENNRLYYIHNTNENDTLEYIQIAFNIENVLAINGSINFKSYFYGISKAYFILNYVSETTNIYPIRIGFTNINDILPQQQIINQFTFLITDNDNNDYYGNSEGYFSSIKLIYYPDIELTILTISLVEIMIPLIILIIPTLAISLVAGKKAIIPMLILMSIICFIANLIELWVFTIILICLGSFLFLQYKKEKGVN